MSSQSPRQVTFATSVASLRFQWPDSDGHAAMYDIAPRASAISITMVRRHELLAVTGGHQKARVEFFAYSFSVPDLATNALIRLCRVTPFSSSIRSGSNSIFPF